ncbi:DUF1848 domain-containing protein [Faecalicatena contorta]|uniref:DUF1848 domain-containing protein n=1 Tax=Faecalicatena contorta TaxID=39482 RepID=UPI001897E06B|nr:DUF1848 domain-containing protein [Faecalicatena contorta]
MILSVSRRTDIPCCYPDWFYKRVEEGTVCVRNPFRPHQINEIAITPEVTDCIVFWTKNPEPLIAELSRLDEYLYYFQFTLTGYGKDIEPGLPDKAALIEVFQKLAGRIGRKRMIWRYDPILLNPYYTACFHLEAFEKIAGNLQGCTEKVVVSFIDTYKNTRQNADILKLKKTEAGELERLAGQLAETAGRYGMRMAACAEEMEFGRTGIEHGACIDKSLIEELAGCELNAVRDKGQRPGCGCMESIDIGAYNTCMNGCRYCYANYSGTVLKSCRERFAVSSPLLCGSIGADDIVKKRAVKSWKNPQIRLPF